MTENQGRCVRLTRARCEGPHRLTQKRPPRPYRCCSGLLWLRSLTFDFREIFGASRFSTFSTVSRAQRTCRRQDTSDFDPLADVIPDRQPRPLPSAVLTYLIITGQGSIRASLAETKRILQAGA